MMRVTCSQSNFIPGYEEARLRPTPTRGWSCITHAYGEADTESTGQALLKAHEYPVSLCWDLIQPHQQEDST